MTEFSALRTKTYSYLTDGNSEKKKDNIYLNDIWLKSFDIDHVIKKVVCTISVDFSYLLISILIW